MDLQVILIFFFVCSCPHHTQHVLPLCGALKGRAMACSLLGPQCSAKCSMQHVHWELPKAQSPGQEERGPSTQVSESPPWEWTGACGGRRPASPPVRLCEGPGCSGAGVTGRPRQQAHVRGQPRSRAAWDGLGLSICRTAGQFLGARAFAHRCTHTALWPLCRGRTGL